MKRSKDHPGGSPLTDLEIQKTRDGSPTLFSKNYNATYHSLHGAVQESMHVFIHSGLNYFCDHFQATELRIFEMGFGTGLNAWLSCMNRPDGVTIDYHAIELHPVPLFFVNELIKDIEFIGGELDKDLLLNLHALPWNKRNDISEHFSILLEQGDVLSSELKPPYDLVYYDAFGPGTQPELWGDKMTAKLYEKMASPGCLVTYSAQGAFRRSLISSGFKVEKIPGPPGKREMVRAFKP